MMPPVAMRKSEGQLITPMFSFPYDNVRFFIFQSNLYSKIKMFSSDLYLARASLLTTCAFLRAAKVIEDRLETSLEICGKIISHSFPDDFCLHTGRIPAISLWAIS